MRLCRDQCTKVRCVQGLCVSVSKTRGGYSLQQDARLRYRYSSWCLPITHPHLVPELKKE
jgi:hypothetical protein